MLICNYISYGLVFAGLLLACYSDIREQKIWVPVLLGDMCVLLLLRLMTREVSIWLFMASFGMCAFFYLLSIVTREQIGKGDAFLFGVTGAGFGFTDNIVVIYISFVLAFFAAVFLMVVKKVRKSDTMPLAPFVLAASVLLVIGERT